MMDLIVASTGIVTAIYAEAIDLHTLGLATITRASHVEPDERGLWFAEMVDGRTRQETGEHLEALAEHPTALFRVGHLAELRELAHVTVVTDSETEDQTTVRE